MNTGLLFAVTCLSVIVVVVGNYFDHATTLALGIHVSRVMAAICLTACLFTVTLHKTKDKLAMFATFVCSFYIYKTHESAGSFTGLGNLAVISMFTFVAIAIRCGVHLLEKKQCDLESKVSERCNNSH